MWINGRIQSETTLHIWNCRRERALGKKKIFFFSVLPAIFAQSCAQGVTDLWPVCGTANRLFLNARKMHSDPLRKKSRKRRKREKKEWANEFYCTVMARRRKRTSRERLKWRRQKGCFVRRRYSWQCLFRRDGHVSRSRKLSALLECFTNTVKSLLQGGVRYPSRLLALGCKTKMRKKYEWQTTHEKRTIVKSYNAPLSDNFHFFFFSGQIKIIFYREHIRFLNIAAR